MDQARSVTATFTLQTFTLSVSKGGAGSGTVSSSPSGIDCGSDCSEVYDYNTEVTLTATPATGSVFGGWGGACTGTGSCVVTMDQARSVTANFEVGTFVLTVSKAGTGAGIVTSSPAGINCGSDCSESYTYNTSVTLTATPTMGSKFTGWSGGCTGTGSCVVTMDQARSVTATFDGLEYYTLDPCRIIDTRNTGIPLTSGVALIVDVAGNCGVPSTATAIALNVTAISPPNTGRITLYPGDGSAPTASTVNFPALLNRANNAIVRLSDDGDGTLAALAFIAGGGNVDMVLDVTGYFQ
jgi:hypothetical protein